MIVMAASWMEVGISLAPGGFEPERPGLHFVEEVRISLMCVGFRF